MLEAYVTGRLASDASAGLTAHLSGCASCRGLLVDATRSRASARDDESIVRGVLARTSGTACEAAERRLPDFMSGALDPTDAELVAMHVGGCAPCRELAEILGWTPALVREIAFVEPPRGFTREVVRATREIRRPRSLVARLRAAWRGAILRPRFPLELAYGGALLVALLAGAPGAPLHGRLPSALGVARTNPVEVVVTRAETHGVIDAVVTSTGWITTQTVRRAIATTEVFGDAGSHATGLFDAALAGDIGTVSVQLRKVGGDLERLLHAIGTGVAGESSHEHEENDR